MTKKEKVTRWVNENYAGFEFWYDGGNGRYGTSWSFINKETRGYIHVYNVAKTNTYTVDFYADDVEYKLVTILIGDVSEGNFKKEMRWERKNYWGTKPTSTQTVEL